MRTVEFLDTPAFRMEQTPGVNFSIKEKIAIAKTAGEMGHFMPLKLVFQRLVQTHLRQFRRLLRP